MPYVTLDDYVLSVSFSELNDILVQAANGFSISEIEVRLLCESKAESKIRNFLGAKFNLDVEFMSGQEGFRYWRPKSAGRYSHCREFRRSNKIAERV